MLNAICLAVFTPAVRGVDRLAVSMNKSKFPWSVLVFKMVFESFPCRKHLIFAVEYVEVALPGIIIDTELKTVLTIASEAQIHEHPMIDMC